jgi:hypothetical protein
MDEAQLHELVQRAAATIPQPLRGAFVSRVVGTLKGRRDIDDRMVMDADQWRSTCARCITTAVTAGDVASQAEEPRMTPRRRRDLLITALLIVMVALAIAIMISAHG